MKGSDVVLRYETRQRLVKLLKDSSCIVVPDTDRFDALAVRSCSNKKINLSCHREAQTEYCDCASELLFFYLF